MAGQYFEISAYKILEQNKPHRLLTMWTDDQADENWPLISELKAMISWILGGIRDQVLARKKFKKNIIKSNSTFHIIIPVCFSFKYLFCCSLQIFSCISFI
jgi:hypothetical protein